MNDIKDRMDKLEDIKIENFIWVIYIAIIFLSWYANSKEKKYLLYNDEQSKREYQNLLILISSIVSIFSMVTGWRFLKKNCLKKATF